MNKSKDNPVINLGCRLNISEGNHITAMLAQNNGSDNVMVVNSCAVTKEAERKSLQMARKLKRQNPDKKLVFTGCAAQINPEKYQAIDEIDAVIGNDKKLDLRQWGLDAADNNMTNLVGDIFTVTDTALHLLESYRLHHHRAFVQIQNGCDHRCTFCIIPYGRGNSRSVAPSDIMTQIKQLVEQQNIQEIVLTGVDLTSYHYQEGSDKIWQLGHLIQEILIKIPALQRLRISSLDCIEIDEMLMEALHDTRVMPHLHLSLQSGDNLILKRMKRRHQRDEVLELCQTLRDIRPDMVLGADMIAGFPTETEAHFNNSCQLLEECDVTWLHVFPYSAREGTPAAKMPQLDKSIITKRAAILREIAKKRVSHYLHSMVGQNLPILLEPANHIQQNQQQATLLYRGYTPHFADTLIMAQDEPQDNAKADLTGTIASVTIKAVQNHQLMGQFTSKPL